MFKNKPWLKSVALLLAAGLWLAGCASHPPKPAPAPVEKPAAPPPPAMVPAAPVPAQIVKPDYPQRYVVVKGDTLWDIASRFLKDPWLWPEIWQINPYIKNPHLIYPGDVITMYFDIHGRPVLKVERGGVPTPPPGKAPPAQPPVPQGLKTVKLEPKVRSEPLSRAISTIPMSIIGPFLTNSRVVSKKVLDDAPYVVSSYDQHLLTASGNRIYVRDLTAPYHGSYVIVRPGQAYRDPNSGEILGYEAQYLADARLVRTGDPATLDITKSTLETADGDRLLPMGPRPTNFTYLPRAPKQKVSGEIIAVLNGVSQIGQYAVVVLDRGEQAGLAPGNVLAIYQRGPVVRDQTLGGDATVKLPNERAGELMVFRVFDRVSYGLVMTALRPLHVDDIVTNP